MKNIIFFLLLPFVSISQNDIPISVDNSTRCFTMLFSVKENTEEYITFIDSCGQSLRLTRGTTSAVDSIGYEIINEVISAISKMNTDKLSELQWKIAFYERHFGKLTGNPDDGCVDYQLNLNAEPMKKCVKIK